MVTNNNPQVGPVLVRVFNPASQPVNPSGSTNEGAYGEDIVAKIREIRQICGEVPRDWCYAALLQYQGDVEHVVRMFKIQRLSKLTGKTELSFVKELCHIALGIWIAQPSTSLRTLGKRMFSSSTKVRTSFQSFQIRESQRPERTRPTWMQ